MKKTFARLVSALVCAALLLAVIPVAARAVTLTAVNDTLLPLSDETMPQRMGGELYVPYTVFTDLGVTADTGDDNVLSLSAAGRTLSFSTAEGYVYDQSLNSYDTPAYELNGTTYVPVKLCCGTFGLTSSTFSAAGETVLRLTDGSAQSDSAFAAALSGSIENAVNAYYGIASGSGQSEQPAPPAPEAPAEAEPTPPPVEEQPTQKPSRVYLTFYGAMTENTAAVLDALEQAGRSATFFLPTDTSKWTDDNVRRLVAEGHTPALLLYAHDYDTTNSLLHALQTANERLTFLTGATTRIVSNANGFEILTQGQRDALIDAGYRLWDSTLDSGDNSSRAAYAYATTAQQLTATTAPVVLRLRHTKETAETVRLLCAYMSRQAIPVQRIMLTTGPLNNTNDPR